MKINAKFRMPIMAAGQGKYKSTIKYLFGIMDEIVLSALIFMQNSGDTKSGSLKLTDLRIGLSTGSSPYFEFLIDWR